MGRSGSVRIAFFGRIGHVRRVPADIPVFWIDAFSSEPFRGNPAVVCLSPGPARSEVMQALAGEFGVSETVFVVARDDDLEIRWFTPTVEIDLCGHGTLAAVRALAEAGRIGEGAVRLASRSGPLSADLVDRETIALDFPARPPRPVDRVDEVAAALGRRPRETLAARDLVAVFDDPAWIAAAEVDPDAVRRLGQPLCITAAGGGADFVSRYFAPAEGIDEDPVTGSAHCTLGPYWADRLGRERLAARQVGPRGGELSVAIRGDRVLLEGRAVTILRGTLSAEVVSCLLVDPPPGATLAP